MSDAELLERHLAGDRTALVRLLELHEAPLLRFARALLGDADLAQDAVQEAFLRLVREGRKLREVKAVFPWLLHVTRNVCFDLRRREGRMDRKHEGAVTAMADRESVPADAPVLAGEAADKVREAISRLPEAQRDVVRLKLWDGLTYREIAAKKGMSLTNVSYHLGQALRTLSGELRSVGIGG